MCMCVLLLCAMCVECCYVCMRENKIVLPSTMCVDCCWIVHRSYMHREDTCKKQNPLIRNTHTQYAIHTPPHTKERMEICLPKKEIIPNTQYTYTIHNTHPFPKSLCTVKLWGRVCIVYRVCVLRIKLIHTWPSIHRSLNTQCIVYAYCVSN